VGSGHDAGPTPEDAAADARPASDAGPEPTPDGSAPPDCDGRYADVVDDYESCAGEGQTCTFFADTGASAPDCDALCALGDGGCIDAIDASEERCATPPDDNRITCDNREHADVLCVCTPL